MEVAWVDGAPRELERMQLWCHGRGTWVLPLP